METDTERRKHPRLEREERLFIQIVTASDDPTLPGKTIHCSTLDVSAFGLKLKMDHAVPVGCLVDLWVSVGDRPGKFFLSGEVKWAREITADELYQIGVELRPEPKSDLPEWQELFE